MTKDKSVEEKIEKEVIRLTRIAHPQDQGEPTSTLENELRQALKERDKFWEAQEMGVAIDCHEHCEQAREEGAKAEREHWINQPANEHDEAIRKAERERIREAVEPLVEEIGKGAFSTDQMQHVKNTIEHAKGVGQEILQAINDTK